MGEATRERNKLADALLAAGPESPTLCEGWTARDLAAHVVVRDRRPDAALGMFVKPLAGHLATVTDSYASEEFADLVGKVRSGPRFSPTRLPPLDNAMNTMEFAIHTEDVRRGSAGWKVQPRDPALEAAVTRRLGLLRRVVARKSPVSIKLASGDGFSAGPEAAEVTVTGDPLELLLFCFGRQGAAKLEYAGDQAAVAKARNAKFDF